MLYPQLSTSLSSMLFLSVLTTETDTEQIRLWYNCRRELKSVSGVDLECVSP